MKEKFKKQKGITLVALVITIIILLILAMVSISIVMNQEIMTKSKETADKYKEEDEKEAIQLGYTKYTTDKYMGITPLKLDVEDAEVSEPTDEAWTITFNKTGNVYTLSTDGKTLEQAWTNNGNGTITKGTTTLSIGDYVAYDATKDTDGNTITGEKATYTSYSENNASSEKNNGRNSGYTSDQKFNLSSYTLGWRVLGIKNGQLQLVSADRILTSTGEEYYLRGNNGYIDGIGELNAISAMYGQGKGATGARSINVDDINDITGYKPEETGDGKPYDSGLMSEYNNKVTVFWDGTKKPYCEYGEESNKKTRNLNQDHDTFNWYDGINLQSSVKSTTAKTDAREKITELTNNFYAYDPMTLTYSSSGDTKGIAKTSKEWEVLFKDTNSKDYLLASRYLSFSSRGDYVSFGVRSVCYEKVASINILFTSFNGKANTWGGVRPVVTLKSDVQIEKTDTNDGSILEKACIIK